MSKFELFILIIRAEILMQRHILFWCFKHWAISIKCLWDDIDYLMVTYYAYNEVRHVR